MAQHYAFLKYGGLNSFINILTKSAFPAHLYDSQLHSKTMRTDCLPKGIHLSQANNVQPDGKLSITVSFMLDFDYCGHERQTDPQRRVLTRIVSMLSRLFLPTTSFGTFH